MAVLAALSQIAKQEKTTVMVLIREAAREVVRKLAQHPALAEQLRTTVWGSAPRLPKKFKTAAQLARFKRAQREFDQVVLEMDLVQPQEVQRATLSRPIVDRCC